jgi:hypothetical protein
MRGHGTRRHGDAETRRCGDVVAEPGNKEIDHFTGINSLLNLQKPVENRLRSPQDFRNLSSGFNRAASEGAAGRSRAVVGDTSP